MNQVGQAVAKGGQKVRVCAGSFCSMVFVLRLTVQRGLSSFPKFEVSLHYSPILSFLNSAFVPEELSLRNMPIPHPNRKKNLFTFVDYDGPVLSKDPRLRRKIRRQAMSDVALARRQAGNYGKHNMRQEPPFLTMFVRNGGTSIIEGVGHLPTCPQTSQSGSSKSNCDQLKQALAKIPTPLKTDILPESSFALLQLVPMAGLRLGITPNASQPWFTIADGKLFTEPWVGSRAFLSGIPSRYGHVPCLTLAVDCVLTKMRHVLSDCSPRSTAQLLSTLMAYNKALKALQLALDSTETQMKAETLCATEILGVFEVRAFTVEGVLRILNILVSQWQQ